LAQRKSYVGLLWIAAQCRERPRKMKAPDLTEAFKGGHEFDLGWTLPRRSDANLSRASRKAVQLVSTRINIGLSDGKGITSFSNAPQPLAYPAKGMMTISTCWPVTKLSAVSSRPTPRPWEAHGCGHSSSRTTNAARQPTATLRRARRPWLPSRKAGGGSEPRRSHTR
jgi:hypothetical protein